MLNELLGEVCNVFDSVSLFYMQIRDIPWFFSRLENFSMIYFDNLKV